MSQKSKQRILKGLLECPLRSGFIEFDYQLGDTVGELLQTVEQKWGVNYGWTRRSKSSMDYDLIHENDEPEFGLGHGWLIACEDSTGAYVVMRRDEEIPAEAPGSGDTFEVPLFDGHGLRRPGDIEAGVYNVEALRNLGTEHLKIAFKRQYKLPEDKSFDIRFIALAAVTGG